MEDALGLLLFVVYIVCVIGAAAGLTWLVVRFSPSPKSGAAESSKS
ncbi:MAG TPA: hypothetical protein VGF23_00915 [Gaiellaceae bacterium]